MVRVYGQNLDVLRGKAEEVRRLLAGVDGTADQQVERMVEEPTLEIEVDLAKAQQYGIKPGDVRRAAATLLSGIQVGSLFEEQKVFDVVVWGTPEVRGSVEELRELLVDLPDGGHVALGQVANVRIKPALSVIRHDAVSRSIDVTADVGGRDYDAVMADVNERLAQVQFPLEYHAEVLGDQADARAVERRVLGVAAIAAVLVLLLLQAAFASWRLPPPPPWPCRPPWPAALPPCWPAAASCRWARWPGSGWWPPWPSATWSPWSATASSWNATRPSRPARPWSCAPPASALAGPDHRPGHRPGPGAPGGAGNVPGQELLQPWPWSSSAAWSPRPCSPCSSCPPST